MRLRNGFTLLELMLALMLTGGAMLSAMLLLDQLGDGAERIVRDGAAMSRRANGARLMNRLFADARPSDDSTKRFTGDDHTVTLWTLCDVPGGWREPCRAILAIDDRGDSSAIVARLDIGGAFTVREQSGQRRLRYYDPTRSADSVWLGHWSSNVTLPLAIAIVGSGDTTVIPVSARE
jgi:prepilin-type N-terminal cleavage/methylation domain-containing protein